jgi:ABC-type polysaccharide/polyol phosphate transport system ATPase subunit
MEYRRANRNDVDSFVENRIEFVTSIRDIRDIDDFRNRTRQYIQEHIEKDDLIIFIAIDKNKIVSSCMACIFQTAPLPNCPTGTSAELLNVYTLKEYRRNGNA